MRQEIPIEYYQEAQEIFDRLESSLHVQDVEDTHKQIDGIYRDFHTLKGTSQLLGVKPIATISHALETCFEPIRSGKIKLSNELVSIADNCLDLMRKILKVQNVFTVSDNEIEKVLDKLFEITLDLANGNYNLSKEIMYPFTSILKVDENKKIIEKVTPLVELTIEKKEDVALVQKENVGNSENTSIRVSVALLDKLMNLVGEIVLTRNQVLQFAKNSQDNSFINLTQKLNLVTSELQDNVMLTRMQPVGSIFNKFQRTVRDLSLELKKEIELAVFGSDTELDKSLIEAIKDPLTHIVRNSCDHGIELPEVRVQKKKSKVGKISLKAYQEGGQVVLEIKDDGKGLNAKFLKEKALAKGIITPLQFDQMTDNEARFLIFHPGFSTAEKVSTVSGRGVGMDVVKTNIEKVSGHIEIESEIDLGTTIKLKIPLTLAIVPAMIIRNGIEYYTISQVKLKELIRIEENKTQHKIERLQNKDVIRLRGELIPLIYLDEIINQIPYKRKPGEAINIVLLNGKNQVYGLVVDEIADTADIVVKPLPSFLKSTKIFSGSTIMGDGQIALIIDTIGLAEKAHLIGKLKLDELNVKKQEEKFNREIASYLLFKILNSGLYAVPLVLVGRIEEFKQVDINYSGKDILIRYREGLLPLISISNFWSLSSLENLQAQERVQVLVIQRKNRLFGLIVDEVLDIFEGPTDVIPHLKPSIGVLGAIVDQDKSVVGIIDVFAIIDHFLGEIKFNVDTKNIVKRNILLAEDTLFFAKHIMRVLSPLGFIITHAEDGAKAYSLLEQNPKKFDLIISDIEMPNLNGYDFAKKVRSNNDLKSIPMIAVTTHFKESDQNKGKKCGFNIYLEKLRPDEIIDSIVNLLKD